MVVSDAIAERARSSGWARCGPRSTCSRPRTPSPSRRSPRASIAGRSATRRSPRPSTASTPRPSSTAARAALEERPMTPSELGKHSGRALAGSGPGLARLLGAICPAARPGPAARPVGPQGPDREHDARGVDRPDAGGHDGRCPGPAIPAGLRPGERLGHPDLVVVHRPARGRRAAAAAPAHLHGRRGPRAARPRGRRDRRPRPPGPGPLPAAVRQRLPLARRPVAHQRGAVVGPRLRLEGRRSSSMAGSVARGASAGRARPRR